MGCNHVEYTLRSNLHKRTYSYPMESRKLKNWSERIISKVYPILFPGMPVGIAGWLPSNQLRTTCNEILNDKIFGSEFRQIIRHTQQHCYPQKPSVLEVEDIPHDAPT